MGKGERKRRNEQQKRGEKRRKGEKGKKRKKEKKAIGNLVDVAKIQRDHPSCY